MSGVDGGSPRVGGEDQQGALGEGAQLLRAAGLALEGLLFGLRYHGEPSRFLTPTLLPCARIRRRALAVRGSKGEEFL